MAAADADAAYRRLLDKIDSFGDAYVALKTENLALRKQLAAAVPPVPADSVLTQLRTDNIRLSKENEMLRKELQSCIWDHAMPNKK